MRLSAYSKTTADLREVARARDQPFEKRRTSAQTVLRASCTLEVIIKIILVQTDLFRHHFGFFGEA